MQPGQFVHVLAPRHPGLLLPVLPVAGYDRIEGTLHVLLDGRAPERLWALRADEAATFDGPLGRSFELHPRGRFLLVVSDPDGFPRVRAAVREAVAQGRQVTVLMGADTVAEVPPSTLLPDEAEYVVATGDGSLGHRGAVTDVVPDYEAWADQCVAAGTDELLTAMARLAQGRDARMGVARLGRRRGRRGDPVGAGPRRRAWLQVALAHEAGCALGVCLGCVSEAVTGPSRLCRDGPVYASSELRWRSAP